MASLHVFGGLTLALDAQWGADARYLNSLDAAALSAVAGAVTSFLASMQVRQRACRQRIRAVRAVEAISSCTQWSMRHRVRFATACRACRRRMSR